MRKLKKETVHSNDFTSGQFTVVSNEFIDNVLPYITDDMIRVYLCDRRNAKIGVKINVDKIASDLGMRPCDVSNALLKLERCGCYITVDMTKEYSDKLDKCVVSLSENKIITERMIRDGLANGKIDIIESNEYPSGICCKIGEKSFSYIDAGERMSIEEYWDFHSLTGTIKNISEILESPAMASKRGISLKDYAYFAKILKD